MPKSEKAPEEKRGGRPAFLRDKEPRSKAILLRTSEREKLEAMVERAGVSINDIVGLAIIRLWETSRNGRNQPGFVDLEAFAGK